MIKEPQEAQPNSRERKQELAGHELHAQRLSYCFFELNDDLTARIWLNGYKRVAYLVHLQAKRKQPGYLQGCDGTRVALEISSEEKLR